MIHRKSKFHGGTEGRLQSHSILVITLNFDESSSYCIPKIWFMLNFFDMD